MNFKNRYYLISILSFSLLLISGKCDDEKPLAEIQDTLISTQILGNADDGDRTTPADSYAAGGNDLDAEDSKTKASSAAPNKHTLSGKAKAETLNPGGQTIESDEARASSFNKEISSLIVKKAAAFKFNVSLEIKKIELVGDGKLDIAVSANILDNNGHTINGGQIISATLKSKKNTNGVIEIELKEETNMAVTKQPDANGDFNKSFSKPANGIQLAKGNYRIEFDLRLIATAPTAFGPNNIIQRASVENVKAKIELAK